MTTDLSIVSADLGLPNDTAFVHLPERCRQQLSDILQILPQVLDAKPLRAACRQHAGRVDGLSWQALYHRFRRYRVTRDWRDLIERRLAGPEFWAMIGPRGLPKAFCQWAKGIMERHQRTDHGGWAEIIHIWRNHHDYDGHHVARIPGYPRWPEATERTGFPLGWSETNMMRFARPDGYDSAATRIGPFAASLHRPSVLTTRVGLQVGERIEFDDHEYNVKVFFAGQKRAMRPRGFTAVDVLSGHLVPSFKPTLWDEDAEKKKALTERDFMWFVVYWLTRQGYRVEGTTFVVELGTAAIRAEFARRIEQVTQGLVTIERGSMFNEPSHAGQWSPRGKGNFRHKPLIEGAFSLIDNLLARLPGQTGLDRLTAPEELHGREQYLGRLLRDMETMPEEQASLLRLPVLTYSQFLTRAIEAYQAIDSTHEHELEGWARLGFETLDWRPSAELPWMPQERLLSLPAAEQQVMRSLIASDDRLVRARRLSRGEVWQRGAADLKRVAPQYWAELMGIEHGREVTVSRQSMFEFRDPQLSPEPLYFLAAAHGRHFPAGETYLGFVNPFDSSVMQITRANGSHVAIVEAWDLPTKGDTEAVKRSMGRQAQWERERRDLMQSRHHLEAHGRAELVAHNAAVRSVRTTAAERARARVLREFDGSAAELAEQPVLEDGEMTEELGAEALL